MKIYCFSGLGADERVFKFLNLGDGFELINIPWIKPNSQEGLKSYSKRLCETIDVSAPFGLLGVSFGGVIAQEVAGIINPQFTVVISSINNSSGVPLVLRCLPKWFINLMPISFFSMPLFIARFLFGAENKMLLKSILKDTNSSFVKWALKNLSVWGGELQLNNIYYLSGGKDRLMRPFEEAEVIKNGHHFMIVDLSTEVSNKIRLFLKTQNRL